MSAFYFMRNRPDKDGSHRGVFEKNRDRIFATQEICGICGRPVEKENGTFKYKYPHPLSPCIDHIIPINKGGHPSALENLQLAHLSCTREKSDKLFIKNQAIPSQEEITRSDDLPLTFDWLNFRS